jgi:hypothetical protein
MNVLPYYHSLQFVPVPYRSMPFPGMLVLKAVDNYNNKKPPGYKSERP